MDTARLEALLERLQTTKSIDELQGWAHELRDHFGVTHVFYHTATLKSEQVGAFTYSLDWARHYIEHDYRSIDPVVLGAQRRFHPMDWKTLDWSSPQARGMMREALAHGLGNQGWSVPIWGPHGEFALFCLNHMTDDASWETFTRKNAKDILVVAHLMHEQAMRIVNQRGGADHGSLAARAGDADAAEPRAEPGRGGGRAADLGEHAARLYRLGAAQARRAERDPRGGAGAGPGDHRADGGVAEILKQRTVGLC